MIYLKNYSCYNVFNRKAINTFNTLISIEAYADKQENAMRCNNRDNLLLLSFSLKISIFLEAYI